MDVFGEVASFGGVPFFMLLDQDVSNETLEWFEVWEYSDDVGAAFDLSVQKPKHGRVVKSHRESNPDF